MTARAGAETPPSGGGHDDGEAAALVRLDGVRKTYGDTTAVADLTLTLRRNELFTLVGPSGCGKTTTLRLISGFESPTEGTIRINGEPATGVPPERRDTNLVFQQHALFPHMSVAENVGYGLEKDPDVEGDEVARRVESALDLVNLTESGERSPGALSGGQQQRVALARALVNEPAVLLLDEPLSSLDRTLRKQMQAELRRLSDAVEGSFCYVTHDQELAMAVSDRIGVMRDGELVQVGTPAAVYRNPASSFVASFIGDTTLVDGTVEPAAGGAPALTVGDWVTVPVATDATGAVTASIRPEMVARTDDAAADHAFEAVVRERTFQGEAVRYRLAPVGAAEGVTLAASIRDTDAPLSAGERVTAAITGDPVVFDA
ncbi:ABC transporter ATP-binding protein [Halobacterium salinarum]|uniref:ABC transporter ATP-binding protein n=1 Tax=Halobacterium salinarum TaxID=2242 RepID=UPI001F3FBA9C|nr:ABC transporter ATP-binding protein [Halobacterium salinarum]MCF2207298.1 ABC transporter ATP-binding protein [Halobacterium salinarum]